MNLKCRKAIKYIVVGILCLIPLGRYIWQFRDSNISSDPNDWAAFGSFVGGVYSVVVALLVLYIARELARKDEVTSKRKKAVELLYKQIVKINSERVDQKTVQRIYSLLDENKLYITDSLYNEVKGLADYFLEVKGNKAEVDYNKENNVKEHLRSIYNA